MKLTNVDASVLESIDKFKFFEGGLLEFENKLFLLMLGESGRIHMFTINYETELNLIQEFKYDICEILVGGHFYIETR